MAILFGPRRVSSQQIKEFYVWLAIPPEPFSGVTRMSVRPTR